MDRPKIVVFSGPTSTIANSPTLVTSNKGRSGDDRPLSGRFDHLVAQSLYEPITIRIKKFSGHPLEEDASDVYFDDGKDYYEVELHPEDGAYLLPYMARRKDGSERRAPFEAGDMTTVGGKRSFLMPRGFSRTSTGQSQDATSMGRATCSAAWPISSSSESFHQPDTPGKVKRPARTISPTNRSPSAVEPATRI